MKRCPQCEFVYEDDQTLCDMDGSKLAFDSCNLPKLQALTNPSPASGRKSTWRSRLITAMASTVLGTVLVLVYYVSMLPQATQRASRAAEISHTAAAPAAPAFPVQVAPSVASIESTERKPIPETKINNSAEVTIKPVVDREEKREKRKENKRAENAPKPQPAKPTSKTDKPEKESKVGNVLRKTGQLLKKPFKF